MSNSFRPDFVVFYAWQSDRPGSRTRYLIQEAAAEAAAQINADPQSPYNVRIDQDTLGVPGLCDIPATILEKIDAADGFLCDLTYVAATQAEKDGDDDFEPRYCSNPNVLFELGYAFRSMGFQRLVCVMNEHYGPAAEQIFDLAHRRFPFVYRMPHDGKSKAAIRAELAENIETAIRQMFPLGRRSDDTTGERISEIRAKFEAQVRTEAFHQLGRKHGAIAIAIIPALGKEYTTAKLREHRIPPPGQNGWNNESRGKSVLSVGTCEEQRVGIAELRTDGVILAADTYVLDPSFHQAKHLLVPSEATERAIITSTARYLKTLQEMEALLPWHICVSLLAIKDYWFLVSNSEASRKPYPDDDIRPEPLVVRNLSDIDSPAKIATFLQPVIDFIWREFGFDGSYHYTAGGTYNKRFVF